MCGFPSFMLHQILCYVKFHAASNFLMPTSIARCGLVTRQENEATCFPPKYKGTAGKNGGTKPFTGWGASCFYKYPCDPTWCHSTSWGKWPWFKYDRCFVFLTGVWLHGLIIRYIDVYELGEEVVHLIDTARDRIADHLNRPQYSESPVPQEFSSET